MKNPQPPTNKRPQNRIFRRYTPIRHSSATIASTSAQYSAEYGYALEHFVVYRDVHCGYSE